MSVDDMDKTEETHSNSSDDHDIEMNDFTQEDTDNNCAKPQKKEDDKVISNLWLQWRTMNITMMCLGAGFLLPYHSFVTAVDYFKYSIGNRIEYYFVVCYMVSAFVAVSFSIFITSEKNTKRTIIPGFLALIFIVIAIPLTCILLIKDPATYDSSEEPTNVKIAFWITMAGITFTGLADGILQSALYALAAKLGNSHGLIQKYLVSSNSTKLGGHPGVYTQALQIGTSLAGVIVGFNRIFTKLILSDDNNYTHLQISTFLYFMISAVFLILCIVFFYLSSKLPFAAFLMGAEASTLGILPNDQAQPTSVKFTWPMFVKVSKQIWGMAFGAFYSFFITLIVFPAMVSDIPSANGLGDWFTIILVTVFNIMDFVGRQSLAIRVIRNFFSDFQLIILSVVRTIFVPIIIIFIQPRLVDSDILALFVVIILGLTNGYTGALCMVRGPIGVVDTEQDLAGRIMAFALLTGLTAGAVASAMFREWYFTG